MDVSLSKFWEMVEDRETWCAESVGSQQLDTPEQLNKSKAYLAKMI